MLEELWAGVEKECGIYDVRMYRARISLSSEKDGDDPKIKNLKRNAAISTYVMKTLVCLLISIIFYSVKTYISMKKKEEKENDSFTSPPSSDQFSLSIYSRHRYT